MNNILEIKYNTNSLFNAIPDTEFIKIIESAVELLHFRPSILKKINADQDRLAKAKKKLRLEDQRYYQNKNKMLPGFETEQKEIVAEELELMTGRERMQPQIAYLFLMIRGYWGSVTDKDSIQRMHDSMTLNILFQNWCIKMPGAITILENLNCVSNKTRDFIFDCQIEYIIKQRLDDFKELTIDSTDIKANTAWPTDSKILAALLNRALQYAQLLKNFEIENFKPHWVPRWIKKINSLTFKINLTQGKVKSKGKIKKYYAQILKTAQKAHDYLISEIERTAESVKKIDLCPSKYNKLQEIWNKINKDVLDTADVLYYTNDRIFNGIVLKASEKILSLCDRSAAFIKKGNRNPVIGYKPQIARSKNGFVAGIMVQEGNTNDSTELLPVVDAVFKRTCVIPKVISTDDGYASIANRENLKERGVAVISMSGAKGKKITPVSIWNSKAYEEARNNRSSVESIIFTLKYVYDFGLVKRRGIEAVRAELLEKVIVYNFNRITMLSKSNSPQVAEAS